MLDETWEKILDALRAGCDESEGKDWTVGVDSTVVRAHQHAAGARHAPPRDLPPGGSCKAYSSAANGAHLRERRITAVIPVKADQAANRREKGSRGGRPPAFDAERYKERNSVERAFNKLRGHRAVATRYDQRDRIYQGTIDVASIRIWLRDPVT